MGTDAGDVLLLPVEGGRGQLVRGDGLQPDVDVLLQGDGSAHIWRQLLAGDLEQNGLFLEIFVGLFRSWPMWGFNGFLLGLAAFSCGIAAHGDYQQILPPRFRILAIPPASLSL